MKSFGVFVKNVLVLVALLSSASAMAFGGSEQCTVVRPAVKQLPKNSVVSITLPDRGTGDKLLLSGYSLVCDRDGSYCAFAATINSKGTQYAFDEDSIVTVKRNVHGKLAGSGTFQSPNYNGGKAMNLSCKNVMYEAK